MEANASLQRKWWWGLCHSLQFSSLPKKDTSIVVIPIQLSYLHIMSDFLTTLL